MYRLSDIGTFVSHLRVDVRNFLPLNFSKLLIQILLYNYPKSLLLEIFALIFAQDFKNIYLFIILFGGQKVITFSLNCGYFYLCSSIALTFHIASLKNKKLCSTIINILCIDFHFNKHFSYIVIYFQEIFRGGLTCI